jgi:hypothetical protein
MGEMNADQVRRAHNLNKAMVAVLVSAVLHPQFVVSGAGSTLAALVRRRLAVSLGASRIRLLSSGREAALILAGARDRTAALVRPLTVSHGSTVISVVPAAPCGLADCVGELHVSIKLSAIKAHISESARIAIIEALGGRP